MSNKYPVSISIYPLPFDVMSDIIEWNKETFGDQDDKWAVGFGNIKFVNSDYANWFRLRWSDTLYEHKHGDEQ